MVVLWEELRHKDVPARQRERHITSMAGDSETHLRDRDENTNIIRQPFLIGVSGGTASGKVGTLAHSHDFEVALTLNHGRGSVGSPVLVNRVASATQRSGLIDSSIICFNVQLFASAGLA